jgi:hypothetical protein
MTQSEKEHYKFDLTIAIITSLGIGLVFGVAICAMILKP